MGRGFRYFSLPAHPHQMSLDQKDFDMANGRYILDWRNDPHYYSAVNLDRDVPDYDPDEDEGEDEDWEDLEDDTHDGGSHDESKGNDDWSGPDEDLD